jgi:hypothetical protein
MYYKSLPKEPLLCDSFVPKLLDKYKEPKKYVKYVKLIAFIITTNVAKNFDFGGQVN